MLFSLGLAFTDYLVEVNAFTFNSSNKGTIKTSYGGIFNLISNQDYLPKANYHVLCDGSMVSKSNAGNVTYHPVFDSQPSAIVLTEINKGIRSSIADICFLDLSQYNYFVNHTFSHSVAHVLYLDLFILPPLPTLITTIVCDLCLNHDCTDSSTYQKTLEIIGLNISRLIANQPNIKIYISLSHESIDSNIVQYILTLAPDICIIAHSPLKVQVIDSDRSVTLTNKFYLNKHSKSINGLGDIFTLIVADRLCFGDDIQSAVVNSQREVLKFLSI